MNDLKNNLVPPGTTVEPVAVEQQHNVKSGFVWNESQLVWPMGMPSGFGAIDDLSEHLLSLMEKEATEAPKIVESVASKHDKNHFNHWGQAAMIPASVTCDTEEQCPLPKIVKMTPSAESSMLAHVFPLFVVIDRSLLGNSNQAECEGLARLVSTGDTGVHGNDFGKKHGNVSALSVAIKAYGNFDTNISKRGGCRG